MRLPSFSVVAGPLRLAFQLAALAAQAEVDRMAVRVGEDPLQNRVKIEGILWRAGQRRSVKHTDHRLVGMMEEVEQGHRIVPG